MSSTTTTALVSMSLRTEVSSLIPVLLFLKVTSSFFSLFWAGLLHLVSPACLLLSVSLLFLRGLSHLARHSLSRSRWLHTSPLASVSRQPHSFFLCGLSQHHGAAASEMLLSGSLVSSSFGPLCTQESCISPRCLFTQGWQYYSRTQSWEKSRWKISSAANCKE